MPSLQQLLRDYAPLLVIDAASLRVQVGIFATGGDVRWVAQTDEAGVAVFRGVERLDINLSSVRAFVFCEGPGSTLGIRTVAMAIRTWQLLLPRPCFAYGSLALVAHALARSEITVIADARRDSWHAQKIGGALRRLPTSELKGPLVTPEHFRSWNALPAELTVTPYDVSKLFENAATANLFQETTTPDAFLHEEPNYATWTPQIHRSPTAI